MRIFAHNCLALVTALAVFTGCAASTHTNLPTSTIRTRGALLTRSQAISIAKRAVEREGFRLTNYKEPDASFLIQYGFRSRRTYWSVGFESKILVPDVAFITVFVDDQTQKAELALRY